MMFGSYTGELIAFWTAKRTRSAALVIACCFCVATIILKLIDFSRPELPITLKSARKSLRQKSEIHLWPIEEPIDEIIPYNHTAVRREIQTYVVYNAFIYEKRNNWDQIISRQLQNLNDIGLSENATAIYVHLSTRHANESDSVVANGVRQVT